MTGPIFFGILAELDMTTLASKILTFLLNSESLELNNNSFTISKESKLCIYEKLSSIKEEYRCSDLTLALSTFGMEKKTTLYYRIIERIEGELSSKIVQMKIRDVLNILNAYSYSKRLYPGNVKESHLFDKKVQPKKMLFKIERPSSILRKLFYSFIYAILLYFPSLSIFIYILSSFLLVIYILLLPLL